MPNKVLQSKKYQRGPQKMKKKLFFSKKAYIMFYLKSYMASVNLMGTSFTGICLEHQLSIFWFTRRGVLSTVGTIPPIGIALHLGMSPHNYIKVIKIINFQFFGSPGEGC